MSKYNCPLGEPIDVLIEECSELIQELCKAKRFGLDGIEEYVKQGGEPPKENIIKEIGDVFWAVTRFCHHYGIDEKIIAQAINKKAERVKDLFD